MSDLLQLLAEKLMKTPNSSSLLEKVLLLAKSMFISCFFHESSHFLQLLAEKLMKTAKDPSLPEKLLVLAKSMIFHAFSRNGRLFASFRRKVDENGEIF